jgi:thymidine kinase
VCSPPKKKVHMSSLVFYFGTVSSSKTARLLVAFHAYRNHAHSEAWLIKPSVDVRKGRDRVWSRVPGLEQKADCVVGPQERIPPPPKGTQCVFVDEAQFFTKEQIQQLWHISKEIPVRCYGLRTNYLGELFEGARWLMAWADDIVHIDRMCHWCNKQAFFNMKLLDGKPDFKGKGEVELGTEELYIPVCKWCVSRQSPLNMKKV